MVRAAINQSITISIVLSDVYAIPKNYLICQQVTEDSVLSGKLRGKAKLTGLNTLKRAVQFVFHGGKLKSI